MRLVVFILLMIIVGCQSEDAALLVVETQSNIKLDADPIFANLKSFEGLEETVPDLFLKVDINVADGTLTRKIVLPNSAYLIDSLIAVDRTSGLISYHTIQSSWTDQIIRHELNIHELLQGQTSVTWVSNVVVENDSVRQILRTKLEGLQESYLTALEILGEELDFMLNDLN